MEFYGQATKSKEETIVGQEKEQIEIAYVSAAINKLGEKVTAADLQDELDKVATTEVTDNGDRTLNVFFEDSKNNYNVNDGTITKVEPLVAGLYDSNRNQIVSWDDLVNRYGLDISKNYNNHNISTGYRKNPKSLYYILKNNSELSTGTILVIDDSIETIGSYALTTSQLVTIQLPNNITSTGSDAFSSCTSLTNITIPDSVTSIGMKAFDSCTSLSNVTISNNIQVIEDGTFRNCTSLDNLKIPNSVKTIAEGNGNYSGAFSKCTNLKNIEMPNNLKFIGKFAFQGCTSLESIFIPDSVTTIQGHAFSECTSLSNIYIPISVTSMLDRDGGSSPLFEKCNLEIYCGVSSVPDGWGDEWNKKEALGPEYIEPKLGYTREQYEAELNS